ncbi:hypothetical protein FNV43_RR12340 [Rhamnella rubrinervis]|uniref:Uncharacterized protein n=1 Tax=Rhamnella rubrinervis TaxID=2594499 RepID=A0A8K0H7K2_9ROSA|nr:hypothetical protein FNV43_RR12340 [Rhamnella rubrinervis]
MMLPVEKIKEALEGRLRASGLTKSPDVRGVIAPSRVFLLGPSHHHYTPKWALSTASVYKTPIGDLPVDLEVIEELKGTGKFEMMDIRVDEAQRSMEMHLLYLAKVFEGHPVKVVPIFVGALNAEATYRQLLAKYVDDPNNFFSVLSDFCHGGACDYTSHKFYAHFFLWQLFLNMLVNLDASLAFLINLILSSFDTQIPGQNQPAQSTSVATIHNAQGVICPHANNYGPTTIIGYDASITCTNFNPGTNFNPENN